MTVSVIIVSWNTRDLTLQAVESVLAQEFDEPVEVLVVDNASADHTVAALSERYPQVRVFALDRNVGFAGGNNVGLHHARGVYTLLLNSDARLQPGALRTLVDAARRHPDAGALQPMLLSPDGSVQYTWDYLPGLASELWWVLAGRRRAADPAWQARVRGWREVVEVPAVGLAALLVPRAVWRRVGPLATEPFLFFEESDLTIRLQRQGLRRLLVPAAVVEHDIGRSTGQVPYRRRLAHYRSRMWFYDTHRAGFASWLIRCLSRLRASVGLALARRAAARGDAHGARAADELWRPVLRHTAGCRAQKPCDRGSDVP